jgi:hypothetical protein
VLCTQPHQCQLRYTFLSTSHFDCLFQLPDIYLLIISPFPSLIFEIRLNMVALNGSPASFSTLPLKIRQKIWGLTLPGSRIIRVIPASPEKASSSSTTKISTPNSNSASTLSPTSFSPLPAPPTYQTLPSSWGGIIAPTLHINRESRAFALLHLTVRFNCYWNFDFDILYVELPFLGQVDAASKQLSDMRKRGLLDGVKHLAVDWEMWDWRSTEEHWYAILSILLYSQVT